MRRMCKNFAWFGLAKVGKGTRCLNDKARQLSDLDPIKISQRKKIPTPLSTVECKLYAMNNKKVQCPEYNLRCLGASMMACPIIFLLGKMNFWIFEVFFYFRPKRIERKFAKWLLE